MLRDLKINEKKTSTQQIKKKEKQEKQGVPQNSCDLIMIIVLNQAHNHCQLNWPFFYYLPKR